MNRIKQRRSQQGFTLLELLMVVIIIAILASLALPQYLRTVAKARRAEALQVLATIRAAELRYKAEHGLYTNNASGELDLEYAGDLFDADDTTGTGSWEFSIDPDPAAPTVTATGKANTTVSNCVEEMDVDTGSLPTDDVQPDGSGGGNC